MIEFAERVMGYAGGLDQAEFVETASAKETSRPCSIRSMQIRIYRGALRAS